MRGDVPFMPSSKMGVPPFSPHARGCSGPGRRRDCVEVVFPACAGMFLALVVATSWSVCFPRMRGDVPQNPVTSENDTQFSPHARGCSHQRIQPHPGIQRFPRMRGDVPVGSMFGVLL